MAMEEAEAGLCMDRPEHVIASEARQSPDSN
jgi:hypothetical protein